MSSSEDDNKAKTPIEAPTKTKLVQTTLTQITPIIGKENPIYGPNKVCMKDGFRYTHLNFDHTALLYTSIEAEELCSS